ncbi:hypothetical protein AB0333_08900 [Citricoccus sp. NPDC079358]|jgi:uncharacterized membrane protein|uniref:hypothetical protein n=1 Tax=Citricoccus sp. NPDC079358 TaxID=3154653 RepID=UPI00344B3F94
MSVRPFVSSDARVHGSPDPTAPSTPETSLWLRALLIVGATLTAVSFAATVLLLVSYFLTVTAWPLFYWFGLYGLPLSFVLMLTYVVAKAVLRRRA